LFGFFLVAFFLRFLSLWYVANYKSKQFNKQIHKALTWVNMAVQEGQKAVFVKDIINA